MAQWGNTDDAANSVLWAATSVKLAPNTTNQTALFGNTTADAFITGETIGQYGVDPSEVTASRAGAKPRPAHAGWVLRTEGSGGRAGRVQQEVLVAMSTITGDAADDVVLPDYTLRFTTQPASATGDISNNDVVLFTSLAASTPAGATIAYQWEANTGSGFANLSNGGAYAGVTTAQLSVTANTVGLANGTQYRVVARATGAANVTSSVATITVVA